MNFFQKFYQLYYKPKIFYPKKSYSIFGEDIFINNFFKNNYGNYIDIGCYHPLHGSNTYLLYKRGWRGINIDLNKLSIELFKIKRPEDKNIRIIVSNKKERKKKFYYRKKINMLNTTEKKIAEKNFLKGYGIDYLKSDTLNNILKNSKLNKSIIDLINIDVEGHEYSILKKFSFKKYQPKLMCVEIHSKNFKKEKIYKLLKKNKYKIVFKNKYSFIFKFEK